MGLTEYRRKRKFDETPEPAGGGKRGGRRFVVQLHHASHRHYDFRLELDGTLKSWAVPKGPSFDPAVKRLAMEVEDHPISYASFEGDIPEGHYGAGHVDIYDEGTWEPEGGAREGLAKGELKFSLHGDVLRGSWVLVRTRKVGKQQQWLLIKHDDAYAGSREADDFVDGRSDRPIAASKRKQVWKNVDAPSKAAAKRPARQRPAKASAAKAAGAKKEKLQDEPFAPELCVSRDAPPDGDEWLHEVKWDGYRIVATVVRGNVKLWSRNAIEWTSRVPEIAAAVRSLGLKSAQLDGEMIVLRDGAVDFNALQGRLSAENKLPVTYMLFDVPYLDGMSLRAVPLVERKARLEALLAAHPDPVLAYSAHQLGHGKAMFKEATKAGFEGIVSKRVDSGYSGRRNGEWVKVKRRASDEFVVVGYTQPKGSRAGIGALLLARRTAGGFAYAGRAGTGLDNAMLRQLGKTLARDAVDEPVVDVDLIEKRDQRAATWVKPRLVVEVFHQGVGGQGLLRQPAFKALRPDKRPADLAASPGGRTKEKSSMSTSAGSTARKRAPSAKKKTSTSNDAAASGVTITHPDREVFPGTGITKGDVANYYEAVADWILPEIAGRPLSVVRCPDGIGQACFFQKHLGRGWGDHVRGVPIREKSGKKEYLCIDDRQGLLELVQMNVLEFHPWGAMADDPAHCDRIVLDLDPHAGVAWKRVAAAARAVRKQLASIGLESFLRTSGGKGLHVVIPLDPAEPWEAAKAFAQAVAQSMTELLPKEFVAVAGEQHRKDRIFIDWLRNARGATSVASYSLRARASAGVAMPLAWETLGKVKRGDAFTLANAPAAIGRRAKDPWESIARVKQSLPDL